MRTEIADGNWRRPATVIVAVGAIGMTLILVWVGSWLTIWFDEWNFIFGRQTLELDTFLEPHVDAFVAVPTAVYYVLLNTFGLTSYYPLLFADWLAHFACVALLGLIVSRRSGVLIGMMAALSLLFLGSAFETLLQPFQMQYLFAAAGGLLALFALDRDARNARHYVVATIALLIAIASSGVGPIMAGLVFVWALMRRDRPALLIAAIALVAYGIWYLAWYGALSRVAGFGTNLPLIPIELLYGLGAAVTGVIGLPPARFAWLGLVVGVALISFALWRGLRPAPLAIAAFLALVAEYGLQALFRGSMGLDHGARSAYLYPAAIFIWLAVAATLGRRLDPGQLTAPRRRLVALAVALLIVPMMLGNMAQFYLAARAMQPLRATEARELALLVLLRDTPGLNLDTAADPELLPQVTAREYFKAIDRFGSPQIAGSRPADDMPGPDASALNFLAVRLLGGAIAIGPQGDAAPIAPTLDVVSGDVSTGGDGCTALAPEPDGGAEARWSPPTAGIAIYAQSATDAPPSDVELFVGLFEPAEAPVDTSVSVAIERAETIWLPTLPQGLSWTLTLKVASDQAVLICSKQ